MRAASIRLPRRRPADPSKGRCKMSKQRKSKAAKAESPKPATPHEVLAPQVALKSFGGVVLEIGRYLSESIPDATKSLPPISCDAQGRETYPLVGKATPQQYGARLLAVKRFMCSIPGGMHTFADGAIQWDHGRWEQETGQTFPLSMQEAAALSEKISYMRATDFVNAGYTMDAAVVVLSKEMSRRRRLPSLQAGSGDRNSGPVAADNATTSITNHFYGDVQTGAIGAGINVEKPIQVARREPAPEKAKKWWEKIPKWISVTASLLKSLLFFWKLI